MTCMTGRQAWAALQHNGGLYMAILNWMLPDLDGYRIAQRLYEQQDPVIAVLMIPRAVLPEAWTGLNLRAHFVLTKPLMRAEIDHLIGSTVAHVFDRHAAGNGACGEPANAPLGREVLDR
jgi:DNA-binding response OmpR family regulator